MSKTTLATNILQARVEANEKQIQQMVQDYADIWGIETDVAEASILKDMGWNPSKMPDGLSS